MVTLLLAAAPARAALLPFTAGVGTLATPEWSLKAEGATVVQTVSPGSGVSFRFFDFTAPSALVRDAFSVQPAYGQVPGSHANGDFSNRSGFALRLRNDGAAAVWASLVINTGFTGPSGTPSFDSANDTFWQSAWTHLDPGAGLRLLLNFDAAIPWNVEDNPLPHTQGGTDGVAMAINAFDRAEVSSIGFQVWTDAGEATLFASPASVPEPAALLLLGLGSSAGLIRKAYRRARVTPDDASRIAPNHP